MALKVRWTKPAREIRSGGDVAIIPAETVEDAYVAVERVEYYRRTKTVVALVQAYRAKDGERLGPMLEFGFDPDGPQIPFDPSKDDAATVYDWLKANDPRFSGAEDV